MTFDLIKYEEQKKQAEQLICGEADKILQGFVNKGIAVGVSLAILKQAQKAIEISLNDSKWGKPLVCKTVTGVFTWEGTRQDINPLTECCRDDCV